MNVPYQEPGEDKREELESLCSKFYEKEYVWNWSKYLTSIADILANKSRSGIMGQRIIIMNLPLQPDRPLSSSF